MQAEADAHNELTETGMQKDCNDESLDRICEAKFDAVWDFFERWSLRAGTLFGVKIRIHFINLLWVGLLFYYYEDSYYLYPKSALFISVIFALLSHEMCHALVARYFGNEVKGIVLILPIGALALINLKSDKPLVRLAIFLAGPLINLLMVLAIYLLVTNFPNLIHSFYWRSSVRTFFIVSLSIGIFNLIPLFPMDGGQIFRNIMFLCKAGNRAADITTLIVSFACFIGLVFLSLKADAVLTLILSILLIIVAVLELGFASRLSGKEEVT